MHSARKCCIFAPAIERTAFCALLGSSIKTNTGYKRWQAPVINEDPENGRNEAFWGVAKQRTLNILQTTMINYSIVMRSVNANLLEINQARVLAPSPAYPPTKNSTLNIQHSKKMKANTWKTILQIAISILTAIATTLGVTSCMG